MFRGPHARNTPRQNAVVPKSQTTSPITAHFHRGGLRFGRYISIRCRSSSTDRGELRHPSLRHADDTPPEGFAWRKTPIATGVEGTEKTQDRDAALALVPGPGPAPDNFACNSKTQVTQHRRSIRTSTMPEGNCMRNYYGVGGVRPGCGGGAWPRCPWAVAGPGRASRRRAAPISTPGTTGVEGAGGSGGPGCGAGGRWRGLAGLRGDAPSEARGADGSRAGRRPPAHQAARPSRHPGTPKGRVPKYPPLTQPLPRRGSGRMIVSPGDGDASTGTCRQRRPLPGQHRRSGRRSRCGRGPSSAWWPGRRARRNRSSRR